MANSKFKLKNFRVFDEKGVEFEIAPITVLTGCNSSGKSSVIKSLMLFGDMYQNINNDYLNRNPVFLNQYEIKFNSGKHNLGTYLNTVSKYSNNKDISIGFSKYSNYLMDTIHIEIVMSINEMDFLKNGIIKNIRISSNENEIAYFEVIDKNLNYRLNAIEIKKRFFEFYKCYEEYELLSTELKRNGSFDDMLFYKDFENYLNDKSINHRRIDSIINADAQAISRDNVEKLYSSLSKIDARYQSLFYLPVLDWFGEANKDNITELLYKKINDFKDASEDFNLIEKTLFRMIEDFKKSEYRTIKEYFLSIETKFLTNFSETLHLAKNPNGESSQSLQDIYIMLGNVTSFIGLIHKLFNIDEPRQAIDIDRIISRDLDDAKLMGSLSSLEKNFFTLVKLSSFDKNFYKNRIEEKIPDQMDNSFYIYYSPKELNAVNLFLSAILQDCFINAPSFLNKIDFVEAVKANIQRMYTFKNQGSPFNELIQNYFTGINKNARDKTNEYSIGDFIRKWLRKFEIGNDINFELTPDGLGVHIFLIKEGEKILLADEGYGITQLLPIMLQIELNIVDNSFKYSHSFVKGEEIRYKESTIAIEEPESNLHPKFQSLLAEMFIDSYKTYNIRFIVETHSEYLIRKLQTLVAKKEISSEDVSLNYIYHHDKAKRPTGKPQVLNIKINEDGSLTDEFGTGFFDEALNWKLELMKLKNHQKN